MFSLQKTEITTRNVATLSTRNTTCLCFHLIYDLATNDRGPNRQEPLTVNIARERSVVNVKSFDAMQKGERKENGFPGSHLRKYTRKQIQRHASWYPDYATS